MADRHLLRLGDGHLATKPDGHLALETVPSYNCDPDLLVASYCLDGYSDGDLTACDPCEDATTQPVWDGSFIQFDQTPPYDCDPDPGIPIRWLELTGISSIDGKLNGTSTVVGWSAPACGWYLSVTCLGPGGLIWEGTKFSGDTPVGTYTRTDGCDATATLDIVEC